MRLSTNKKNLEFPNIRKRFAQLRKELRKIYLFRNTNIAAVTSRKNVLSSSLLLPVPVFV